MSKETFCSFIHSLAHRLAFLQKSSLSRAASSHQTHPKWCEKPRTDNQTIMNSNESRWHIKSSVRRGGYDDISQTWHVGCQLQSVARSAKRSSSAALDAYLAKYHQIGQSGQPQRMKDGIGSTGRRAQCAADRQVLSTFLPLEKTAHVQPESPLSWFKKQAVRVAWKSADSRESDAENFDLSDIPIEDHHQQRFPVANPELTSSLNDRRILDNRYSSMNEEDPSLEILTSTSARAVLDRICESKLLGGQPTKRTFALLPKVTCSQQQELPDRNNQQGSEVIKKSVDEELGDASNMEVDRDPEELLGDSQVEVLPVPLPPVSSTPRLPTASQQPLPELQGKLMIPSDFHPELPSSGKRGQTRQENKSHVCVETILKVTKATLLIQRAWKQRQEWRHQQQQLPSVVHDSEDSFSGDSKEAAHTTETLDQHEPQQPALLLPRPPQSVRPRVSLIKTKPAKEPSADAFTAHILIGVACQDEEDTSGTDRPTPTTEAAPHEPIEALWADDEWVCLEEGGYLGALEDAFGSQDAPSRKQNEANLLIWRHPQKLIERRESERVAWWQQHKRDKDTVKMAPSGFGGCEVLPVEPTSTTTTQTESEDARELLARGEVGNSVGLFAMSKRKALHIPLPNYGRARKSRRLRRIRVQVSSTLGRQRAKMAKDQEMSGTEVKQLSTCDAELGVEGEEEESHLSVTAFDRFVVFSSPSKDAEANGAFVDQRNDLISLRGVGARGALSWVSGATSEICGFIPLYSVTMERVPSTAFSTRLSESSGSRQCSGEGVNSTIEVRDDVSASLHHISSAYDPSTVVDEDGERYKSQQRTEFETDDLGLQVVDDSRLIPEEEPAMAIYHPIALENRHVAKAFGDEFASQQASELAMEWNRHHRESNMQVDEISGLCGRPVHCVDAAKKAEFRQILDEFKASLRQSVSVSSSPSSLASSAQFSASLDSSTCTKTPYVPEDEPTQTASNTSDDPERDGEEGGVEAEELQAMLQEINHFKQQFALPRTNNEAPA